MTLPGQHNDSELKSAFDVTKNRKETLKKRVKDKVRDVWCVFTDTVSGK